ncbi:MAG: transposase [Desulfobacterales bacterium]
MFRKNTKHLQPALISAASELPKKQLKLLKGSWANSFYEDFFCLIDEEGFSDLYSDEPSRPNVPVNVLVGLEVMKSGFGWSDEDLYENFCFNLQVRYALGYDRLGDGEFAIRTLYYFRERLSKHYLETGENLLEQAFKQITDTQIHNLQVRTGMQRMDSTQIASNIVNASRLQLLVEAIQRVHRILGERDRERLADSFAPYLKGTAGQYTYRVKGKTALEEHFQQIGVTIHNLLKELKNEYAEEPAYQILERIFAEQFKLIEGQIFTKENRELGSDCLQSVDDLEASYRIKGNTHYKGYVANLTETCDPENELQLITNVQVAPNNIDDTQLLEEALPELEKRTEIETLYTDGGYGSPETDETLVEKDIQQIQTAIRGRKPSSEKLHLSDFEIKQTKEGKPTQITCPQGQKVKVQLSNQRKSFVAHFELDDCQTCPYAQACPAKPGKRDPRRHLRFTQKQTNVAQRRRRSQIYLEEGRNLRAAVEATVRQVKHPFPASKLPVRGQFRVTCMVIGSAIMSNIKRIQKHRALKLEKTDDKNPQIEQESIQPSSFRSFLTNFISMFSHPITRRTGVLCC